MNAPTTRTRPARVVIVDDTYDLRELLAPRADPRRHGGRRRRPATAWPASRRSALERPRRRAARPLRCRVHGRTSRRCRSIRRLVPAAKIIVLSGFGATQMSERGARHRRRRLPAEGDVAQADPATTSRGIVDGSHRSADAGTRRADTARRSSELRGSASAAAAPDHDRLAGLGRADGGSAARRRRLRPRRRRPGAAPRGSPRARRAAPRCGPTRAATRFSSSRIRRTPSMPMPDEVRSEISRSRSMSRGGVAAPAAAGAAGRDQPHPLVGAQGLRVQPGQLGGDADHEDRGVGAGRAERSGCLPAISWPQASSNSLARSGLAGRGGAVGLDRLAGGGVERRPGTWTSTVASRSPLVPSFLRAPLPRTRKVRPLGVPAGTLRVTGAPPRVGILISAPSAASSKEIGTSRVRLSPLRPNSRCGVDLHRDVEVAGRAAVLAGRALAAQPDPLAVLDAGRDARLDRRAPTGRGRCRGRSGRARRRSSCRPPHAGQVSLSENAPPSGVDDEAGALALAGRSCGLVPGLPPVPMQSGHGASEVSRSEMVTPSMASVKPIVAVVSTSAPFCGRAAAAGCGRGRSRRRTGRRTCRRARRRRRRPAAVTQQVVEVEPAAAATEAAAEAARAVELAHLVVLLALLGVADDVVGLGDRLELLVLRVVAGVGVGVVGARELAVGLLDVGRRRRPSSRRARRRSPSGPSRPGSRSVVAHARTPLSTRRRRSVVGRPDGSARLSARRRLRRTPASVGPGTGSTTSTCAARTTRSPIR